MALLLAEILRRSNNVAAQIPTGKCREDDYNRGNCWTSGGRWLAEGMSTEPWRPLTTGLTVSRNFLLSGMIRPWMRAELPNVFNTPIVDNPRLPPNSAKCGQVTNLAAQQWGVAIGLRLVLWTKPAVAGDARQRPGRGIAPGQCDAGSKTEEMEIFDE